METLSEELVERSFKEPVLIETGNGKNVYLYRNIKCWFDRIEYDRDPVFYEHVLSTEYYEKLNQNKGDDSDWMVYQPPIDKW